MQGLEVLASEWSDYFKALFNKVSRDLHKPHVLSEFQVTAISYQANLVNQERGQALHHE